ncbi:MAG: RNA polymerase sigma factor [Acidobacteria bacterium]|nr:RNA polymerase sigma factor [Acidobacteriota bacterium]
MNGEDHLIQQLLKKTQEGDEKSFEELVKIFTPSLFRLVYQITLNYADTEEILQETFYRFFLAIKRVKEGDPFPFLRQIAIRRSYTFIKKRKMEISFEELPEESKEFIVEGKPLEIKEIYQFASSLPAKRRIVFILREILGFEDEEISKELKISETTVRRHSQIAREELKKKFNL